MKKTNYSLVFQSDFKIFAKKTITHAMQHIFSTEFVGSSNTYTYLYGNTETN